MKNKRSVCFLIVALDTVIIAQEMSYLMSPKRRDEILFKKHFCLPENEYKNLAVAKRFTVLFKQLHSDVCSFPNVDNIATTTFFIHHAKADQDALEAFKH